MLPVAVVFVVAAVAVVAVPAIGLRLLLLIMLIIKIRADPTVFFHSQSRMSYGLSAVTGRSGHWEFLRPPSLTSEFRKNAVIPVISVPHCFSQARVTILLFHIIINSPAASRRHRTGDKGHS